MMLKELIDTKTNSYSIWLVPAQNEESFAKLEQLIHPLAIRFQTPVFPAHLTLLSRIPLESNQSLLQKQGQKLAKRMESLPLHLIKIGGLEQFYRCLFIEVEKSVSLIKVYHEACTLFEKTPSESYFPHVSLIYGKLDQNTKDNLTKELAGHSILNQIVWFSELWLVRTEGFVTDWKVLEKWRFIK